MPAVTVTIVQHRDVAALRSAAAKAGATVEGDREIMAWSTLHGASCTVHVIDPSISYQPQWLGHEIAHCFWGRWHAERVRHWLHALLVALDQLAYVMLAGPKYLIVGGPEPSAQETISSKVGRMANKGHRWALIAQPIIDKLFELLGSAPGHCQRAIVWAAAPD